LLTMMTRMKSLETCPILCRDLVDLNLHRTPCCCRYRPCWTAVSITLENHVPNKFRTADHSPAPTRCWSTAIGDGIAAKALSSVLGSSIRVTCILTSARAQSNIHHIPASIGLYTIRQRSRTLVISVTAKGGPAGRAGVCAWSSQCRIGSLVD
jgi:hypothetical protein